MRGGKISKSSKGRLAILGASGHGTVVADVALTAGWVNVHFFDDDWPELTAIGQWLVQGNTRTLFENAGIFDGVVVSIGSNTKRREKQIMLEDAGLNVVSIIHPAAIISPYSVIGKGSVVLAGVVINAFSTIGSGCIINTSSSVDHNCKLEDFVHISPGAHLGGGVCVGEATWIGIGASVKHGISIGSSVVVGAGAVVVNDIVSELTVVGVPARPLNRKTGVP